MTINRKHLFAEHLKSFYSALIAGFMIGLGCIIFLSIENKILGSLFFAVGLLTILLLKLNLFTGKAPYICQNDLKYCGFVGIVWIGNFIGAGFTAFIVRYTRLSEDLMTKCRLLVELKVTDSLTSLFILGILCGILMYVAVDTFNKHGQTKNFSSTILTLLCVCVFIISGYEHSVADMFYFMLVLPIEHWWLQLLVITAGNLVGGNLFCFINNLLKETH
jgi:formate/nitrite transporter FocA (FNT family)